MNHNTQYVLGLHPSSRGFGWILFEGPLSPFDWGAVDIRFNRNARALARIEEIMDKYQPEILALEAFEGEEAHRSGRIRKLYRGIIRRAEARRIVVCIYSRPQIRAAFTGTGAQTREEIAAVIAEHIEALRPKLPKRRKIWIGEHPNIALFCAAACALTFYATERS